ncbi:MAG TPA: TetR/AcrR family transcriptional regulator [Solirubrobacteraceae bacterium]|jgi:AcrR family transcriptional regulator|nr:TetR/AcrR family transcriptional regulator [Solirubrobacteraceae bacterium]
MPADPAQEHPRHDGRSAELRGTARARILDAALAEFHDRGYAGTSLQAVAKRAGLTKGAVYWSFRDKQDLFLALVHERLDLPAEALMRLTADAPSDVETAPLVSKGMAELVRTQPAVLSLLFEHWAMAARDPQLRPDWVRRQSELHSAMARALEARHATTGVPLKYSAERLATGILCLAGGIAMEAMVEPAAAPDELFGEILGLIYDGLVLRASSETDP